MLDNRHTAGRGQERRLSRSFALISALMMLCFGAGLSLRTPTALAAGSPRTAPGLKIVKSPAACPVSDKAVAGAYGRSSQAFGYSLVPVRGEGSVLLCRYNGLQNPPPANDPLAGAFGLVGNANVTTPTKVRTLVHELNAVHAHKRTGTVIGCPDDTSNDVIAYFRMGNGKAYRYRLDLTGCEGITSGRVGRFVDGATQIVTAVEALTPPAPYGTLRGTVLICSTLDGVCPQPQSSSALSPSSPTIVCAKPCVIGDQATVELFTQANTLVTTAAVGSKNAFTLYAAPGSYEAEAVETAMTDGGPVSTIHSQIVGPVAPTPVMITAGRTTTVTLDLYRSPIQPESAQR